MTRAFGISCVVITLFAVSFSVPDARADEVETDRDRRSAPANEAAPRERRALLVAAQSAREKGDHAAALTLAEQAGKLKLTASLRRFIAEQQAVLGRVAEAHENALRCRDEASAEPPSPNRDVVFAGCNELAASLREKLGNARVEPAKKEAAIVPQPKVSRQQPIQTQVDEPARKTDVSDERPAPWIAPTLWIAGGVGVVTGAVLFALSEQRYQDFKQRCDVSPCAPGSNEQRTIERLDLIANIGFWGGLGLAAAGTTVHLVGSSGSRRSSALELRLSPRSAAFKGRF